MFGNNNAFDEPDIHRDRKRRNTIFTVTFAITALIILNLILYFFTKV